MSQDLQRKNLGFSETEVDYSSLFGSALWYLQQVVKEQTLPFLSNCTCTAPNCCFRKKELHPVCVCGILGDALYIGGKRGYTQSTFWGSAQYIRGYPEYIGGPPGKVFRILVRYLESIWEMLSTLKGYQCLVIYYSLGSTNILHVHAKFSENPTQALWEGTVSMLTLEIIVFKLS